MSRPWPLVLERGVAGLAHEGERRSGDLAVFVPSARGGLVAVIDGLGHGSAAADAAEAAAEVLLSVISDAAGRHGIRVIARDDGPGIENVELALQDGFTSGGGLGLGLPGARRLVDDFEIETAPGQGTKVTLVMWTRPNARAA